LTRSVHSQLAKQVFLIVGALVLLFEINLAGARATAEESPASSCSEKLQKFVRTIDELFIKKVRDHEQFYAAIREYLPIRGCTVEQVISISSTSKFSTPPFEQYTIYTIMFSDSVVKVTFGVEKATGNIEYPVVMWKGSFL
jgi:hypothetical protein